MPLLLAVLVLVIAAAAAAFLAVIEKSRENSRRVQCGNNLKNLGAFLVPRDMFQFLAVEEDIGICPADPDRELRRARGGNAGSGWEGMSYIRCTPPPTGTGGAQLPAEPIAFCTHHRGGFNVLLDDGRVVFVRDRDDDGREADPEQARLRTLLESPPGSSR